ncbi:carboxypeptidase-like regulatory domain-containing protein [Bremerella sp. JC770]|uniref:carboxypeptidase-like regulatory domain-containing protein n=1 Tax=Bremerella sp. JC770 TaxID=3232137 RepID=UPI00345B30DB
MRDSIENLLHRTAVCFVGALLLTVSGCGSSPVTAFVSGEVTYNGSPLSYADIRFIPNPLGPRGAIAKTDANGHYTLMYDAYTEGILPGEYKVVISTRGSAAARQQKETNSDSATVESGNPYASNPSSQLYGVKESLPLKFSSSKMTELTASVLEGNNEINFDLKD